jgi:hypothetical protein
MGMQDLLANLGTMNSSELMMTDDGNKDDLWDMLFGQQNPEGLSPGLADAAAAATEAGGGSSVPVVAPGFSGCDMGGAVPMSVGSPGLHMGGPAPSRMWGPQPLK